MTTLKSAFRFPIQVQANDDSLLHKSTHVSKRSWRWSCSWNSFALFFKYSQHARLITHYELKMQAFFSPYMSFLEICAHSTCLEWHHNKTETVLLGKDMKCSQHSTFDPNENSWCLDFKAENKQQAFLARNCLCATLNSPRQIIIKNFMAWNQDPVITQGSNDIKMKALSIYKWQRTRI